MALKIGNNEVDNLAIGSTEIDAIMLGSNLVWKKQNKTIYGWHVDPSISDPLQAITYLDDAVNKNPASMYRPVEYIKSTGTQYILTNIIPKYSYKSELEIKFDSTVNSSYGSDYWYIFGISGSGSYGVYCAQTNTSNTIRIRDGYYSTDTSFENINLTNKTTLIMNRPTSYYGNYSLSTNLTIEALDPPTMTIMIFGITFPSDNVQQFCPLKIRNMYLYSFKIYDENNNIIHNLIPVERTSDNELGLYDTITHKFYNNAGTGVFEKGAYIGTDFFDYGDWKDAFFMPKPCMLRYDGTVAYYLNPNDYRLKAEPIDVFTADDRIAQGGWGGAVGDHITQITDPNDTFHWIRCRIKDFYRTGTDRRYVFSCSNPDIQIACGYATSDGVKTWDSGWQNMPYCLNGITSTISDKSQTFVVLRKTDNTAVTPAEIGTLIITEMSSIDLGSFDGNAMMEWPLIWYKFEGPESKEYRPVEYIKSTGTQIIQTDIVPKSTTKIEIDLRFGNDVDGGDTSGYYRCILGASEYDSNDNMIAQMSVNCQNSSSNKNLTFYNKFTWHSGISSNYLSNPSNFDNGSSNIKQTLTINVGIGSWGSQSVDYIAEMQSSFQELSIPIAIFGGNNRLGGNVLPNKVKELEIYNIRMTENNVLIHDLQPMERQSDGELGLYDIITDKFYTNSGTGTFEKGAYLDEGEGYFYCSNRQVDTSYKCWCNVDSNGNVISHFYTAIYNASGTNKLRSLSGISLTEANGAAKVSASALVSRAAVNDTGQTPEWSISQLCDRLLINALLVLLGKSLNTQQTYGFGYTSVSSVSSISTGSMNTKGLFWGSTSSQTDGVKVFGMENWWGAQYDINLGIIFANDRMFAKLTTGTADGSSAAGYNFTGTGYIDVGPVPDNSSRIDTMSFSGYGMYPKGICQYDQDPSTVAKHYCSYLIRATLQMSLELGNYYGSVGSTLQKTTATTPDDRTRSTIQCLHLNGSYEVISHKTGIQVSNYICKEQNGDLYVLASGIGWHDSPWSYHSSDYTAETGPLRFAVVARDSQNGDLYTPADAGSYVTLKQNDPRLFAFGGTIYSEEKASAFTAISLSSDLQDSANSTRLSCKPVKPV